MINSNAEKKKMSTKYSSRHDIVFKLCWCFYDASGTGLHQRVWWTLLSLRVAGKGWYNILLSCQGAMWTGPQPGPLRASLRKRGPSVGGSLLVMYLIWCCFVSHGLFELSRLCSLH